MLDERRERRPQPRLVRVAQRDERAAAALDEERRLAAQQHDVRARNARRTRSGPPRPRQRRPVRLCRIRRREDQRLRLLVLTRTQLPQPLDGAGQRELRAAEAFDEVAAPAGAERLERAQLAVDGTVAARDPLAADAVARDDALPLEEELGERAPVRPLREEPVRERPPSLRRGDRSGP